MPVDDKVQLERFLRLQDSLSARNNSIARWRAMYFLEWDGIPVDGTEKDHEYVIDNTPHEKVELGIDALSAIEPIIEVPLNETPDEVAPDKKNSEKIKAKKRKERMEAEQLERFLAGYWERTEAEARQNIRRLLFLDALVTSYSVARVLWDDEHEEDELPVLIQHIKPEVFYPLPGRRGDMAQYCAWERTYAEVEEEWDITLTPNNPNDNETDKTALTGEFIDCWEKVRKAGEKGEVWHTIFFDGQVVLGPKKTTYRDLPYVWTICKPTDSENVADQALPFIYGLKDLWDTMNRQASDARDLIHYYADPGVIVKTQGGEKPANFALGRGITSYLDVDAGEDAKFISWEGTPPDFQRFSNYLQMAFDRVGFNQPYVAGLPGGTESGFQWTQTTSTQRLKLRPFKRSMEWMLQEINRQILRRLEEHDTEVKTITVYGTDPADKRYQAKLNTKDIKGRYLNLVRINDQIPYDDIQKAQLIRVYREQVNGTPFLPDRFLRTTIAQVPYNEEVEQQIADQQLAFHEQMLQFQVERAIAMKEAQMKAENPALHSAVQEVRSNNRPPQPMMPPQGMQQPMMLGPGNAPPMMQGPPGPPPGSPAPNMPQMPPGVGLPTMGGMPLVNPGSPAALGVNVAPRPQPGSLEQAMAMRRALSQIRR